MDDQVQQIALAAIEEDAIPRDRTGLDGEALRELRDSILRSGLRQPVEVFEIAGATQGPRYGLVSGLRRVTACRELAAMGVARFASVPAFVRPAGDLARTLAMMVEENAVRADPSPYEQGRIAWVARDLGVFPTIEEAVERLYPGASKMKRSRLRALARLAEALDGALCAPETLSLRQAMRLAGAVRDGFGEVMATALQEAGLRDPATQWALLEPYLAEAERMGAGEAQAPGARRRPIRVARPRAGLVIRREMTRDGWRLHFTGPEAASGLMDRVIEEIEAIFAPKPGAA